MKLIHNVRRGLATNSSSSHSLVYFNEPRPGHDDEVDVSSMDTQFGWEQFKLTTRREKLMYAFVSALQQSGASRWSGDPDDDSTAVNIDRFKSMFPDLAAEIDAAESGYIDHQSVTGSETLFKAALNPNVEIWGGNDNGGDPHEDYAEPYSAGSPIDKSKAPAGIERVEYLG